MSFEHRPDSGSIFRNERAQNPAQPSHTGKAMIGGKTYKIAAWVKDKKDGGRYFSLKFTPVEQQQQIDLEKPVASAPIDPEFNDQVPF
jgi:hypothetical protein